MYPALSRTRSNKMEKRMKKIFHILFLVQLAVLLTGCLGDNYEQPNAAVYGSVIDAETGELIPQDVGGEGSQIEIVDIAYDKPDTRRLNFKTDGTYRDNNFFKGQYVVQFNLTNFVPASVKLTSSKGEVESFGENAYALSLKGETKLDIEASGWSPGSPWNALRGTPSRRSACSATLPRTYLTASTTTATTLPSASPSTVC